MKYILIAQTVLILLNMQENDSLNIEMAETKIKKIITQ